MVLHMQQKLNSLKPKEKKAKKGNGKGEVKVEGADGDPVSGAAPVSVTTAAAGARVTAAVGARVTAAAGSAGKGKRLWAGPDGGGDRGSRRRTGGGGGGDHRGSSGGGGDRGSSGGGGGGGRRRGDDRDRDRRRRGDDEDRRGDRERGRRRSKDCRRRKRRRAPNSRDKKRHRRSRAVSPTREGENEADAEDAELEEEEPEEESAEEGSQAQDESCGGEYSDYSKDDSRGDCGVDSAPSKSFVKKDFGGLFLDKTMERDENKISKMRPKSFKECVFQFNGGALDELICMKNNKASAKDKFVAIFGDIPDIMDMPINGEMQNDFRKLLKVLLTKMSAMGMDMTGQRVLESIEELEAASRSRKDSCEDSVPGTPRKSPTVEGSTVQSIVIVTGC